MTPALLKALILPTVKEKTARLEALEPIVDACLEFQNCVEEIGAGAYPPQDVDDLKVHVRTAREAGKKMFDPKINEYVSKVAAQEAVRRDGRERLLTRRLVRVVVLLHRLFHRLFAPSSVFQVRAPQTNDAVRGGGGDDASARVPFGAIHLARMIQSTYLLRIVHTSHDDARELVHQTL